MTRTKFNVPFIFLFLYEDQKIFRKLLSHKHVFHVLEVPKVLKIVRPWPQPKRSSHSVKHQQENPKIQGHISVSPLSHVWQWLVSSTIRGPK